MNTEIEINESQLMKLIELFKEPEYKSLTPDPISMYVKVGESQMENN